MWHMRAVSWGVVWVSGLGSSEILSGAVRSFIEIRVVLLNMRRFMSDIHAIVEARILTLMDDHRDDQ